MESNIHSKPTGCCGACTIQQETFEIGGVASRGNDTSTQSTKVFSTKSYFHQIVKVFSLESFLLYGIPSKQLLLGSGNYTVGESGMWLCNF